MIDKNKYLYWLDSNNPNLEDEVVHREMYSRIGLILHNLQMIEYNIANILSLEEYEEINGKAVVEYDILKIKKKINRKFNKLSKLTFGQLKREIINSKYLSNINIDNLRKIIKYRNYLVHKCFKEKLLDNELLTIEDVDKFVDELNDFEVITNDLNNELLSIFEKHKIKRITLKENFI